MRQCIKSYSYATEALKVLIEFDAISINTIHIHVINVIFYEIRPNIIQICKIAT